GALLDPSFTLPSTQIVKYPQQSTSGIETRERSAGCSTYEPVSAPYTPGAYSRCSRKEVIQPQVPLRLPCYDFAPVIELAFGRCLLAVGARTSGAPNFHGVTGGVYKARERIHRG